MLASEIFFLFVHIFLFDWVKHIFFIWGMLLLFGANGLAQSLDGIGKEKPIRLSGGIALNQLFYSASGIENRRDPYNFILTGNLNVALYGWNIPLSFSYSNQQTSFQQPFNQFSLSPSYKWVKTKIGYGSTSFSPYTLGGHVFYGAAVELAPKGRFKYALMYGRLNKAVEPDTLSESAITPAFKRMGMGLKVSYEHEGDKADLILFKAEDELNSIGYVPEESGVLPEENLVMSFGGRKKLFNRLFLEAELASSAVTRDIRAEETEASNQAFGIFGNFFTPRASTEYYNAFKAGINYTGNGYTVGGGYENVGPGYRTLGAYYFNNDLENITVNGSVALFRGTVNLSANVGVQRDNLDGQKISTMKRTVGSLSAGINASEKLNINLAYSNFLSYTNIRSQFQDINAITPYENLDTLNFTQISQNATATIGYAIKATKTNRQQLMLNLNFQDAKDEQGGTEQPTGSQFYSANTTYAWSNVPQALTFSAALNVFKTQSGFVDNTTIGPTLAVSKGFFDRKLRSNLSVSLNNAYNAGNLQSRVINARIGGAYAIKKKHRLNLNVVAASKYLPDAANNPRYTEYTGTLGYNYNF